MIEPIVATMRTDRRGDDGVRFAVVAGHRRLAAAKLAGLEKVPVILRPMDEEQRVEAMLVENLQREDLTPLEEASAYQRLIDEFGLTPARARRAGRHARKGTSRSGSRCSSCPRHVQGQVDSGGIGVSDALELAKLGDEPERIAAVLDRQDWVPFAAAIEQQLAIVDRSKKVDAVAAKLEKAGATVVKMIDEGAYSSKLPRGVRRLAKNSASIESTALIFDPKKHESEPCHAITIHPRTLEQFPCCTNRKNHPGAKTVQEKRNEAYQRQAGASQSGAQAKRDKLLEQFEESTVGRRTFLAELVSGKSLAKADLFSLIANKLIDDAVEYGDPEQLEIAAVALGLVTRNDDGEIDVDVVDAINQYTAKSDTNLARAALAVTLADTEAQLNAYWGWNDARGYYDLLEKHGYKPLMPRRNDKGRSTEPRSKVDLSWLRPCTCGARAIGYLPARLRGRARHAGGGDVRPAPFGAVELTLDELTALADYAYKTKLTGGDTSLWIRRDSSGVAFVSVGAGRLHRLTPATVTA
jgi:ParB-like chromosome segregation protein Spo0J